MHGRKMVGRRACRRPRGSERSDRRSGEGLGAGLGVRDRRVTGQKLLHCILPLFVLMVRAS